jgi:hypothetical protein
MKENEHVKNQVIFITNPVYDKLHSPGVNELKENDFSHQVQKEYQDDE